MITDQVPQILTYNKKTPTGKKYAEFFSGFPGNQRSNNISVLHGTSCPVPCVNHHGL